MTEFSSEQSQAKAKIAKTGAKIFRFGVVFSVVTMVMSLFSGASTQLINKFSNAKPIPAEQASSGLQPYETPSFHLFDSVFVNEAKAVFVNVATQ